MARLTTYLLSALLAYQTSAHFLLNWPPSVGFDDDKEGTGPCGSFTVDYTKDNVTDFHVDGDTIALTGTHPTTTFLFRATLDQNVKTGFVDLLSGPIAVTGLGANCNPSVPVPGNFSGQKGVIQVVADSPDGILYQCAAVNFVTGTGPTKGETGCNNATGVTMSYISYASESVFVSALGPQGTGTSNQVVSSSSAASGTASSGHKNSAANSMSDAWGLGAAVTVGWVVLVGLVTAGVRLM